MNCYRCGYTSNNPITSHCCPACGGMIVTSELPESKQIFWESTPASQNPLKGLIDTLIQAIFNPDKLFLLVKRSTAGLKPPLLFGLITGSFGATTAFLWSLVTMNTLSGFQEDFAGLDGSTLILAPVYIFVQILLTAAYTHLLMRITRSSTTQFRLTLKTVCYCESAMVLNAIPIFGSMLSLVFWIYLLITGTSVVHSAGKIRVFLILSVPVFILVFITALGLIAALAGGLAATGLLGNIVPFFR
ncbi:MAG: hypothetical protein GX556_00910 [Fibrobacter sp.]|nr:hypothetical protein [Fibrobacter sp.]